VLQLVLLSSMQLPVSLMMYEQFEKQLGFVANSSLQLATNPWEGKDRIMQKHLPRIFV